MDRLVRREARNEEQPELAEPCCLRLPFMSSAAAGWKLWTQQGAEFSLPGLIVSVLAMPMMYFLCSAQAASGGGARKPRTARRRHREHHVRLALARRGGCAAGAARHRCVVGRRRRFTRHRLVSCPRRPRGLGEGSSAAITAPEACIWRPQRLPSDPRHNWSSTTSPSVCVLVQMQRMRRATCVAGDLPSGRFADVLFDCIKQAA